jgi:hypothetical protein
METASKNKEDVLCKFLKPKMMKKLIITLSILMFGLSGLNAQETNSLISQLMKGANVNAEQAQGGAGALFQMAQEKLSTADFAKVSNAVPNMNTLLAAVPSLKPKRTMMGAAAIKLSGNAKVLAVFEKLGISKNKVQLFTPIIVSYVEKNGGKAVAGLLKNALK